MEKHNKEKRALERAAVHHFLRIYNQNHEIRYRLLYQHDKPDAVLQDSKQRKLGLEITHLFYDAEEAKMLLGRSNRTAHGPETLDNWLAELNGLIRKKEEKRHGYESSYPISLLIRNASPVFGMSDLLNAKDGVYRPSNLFQQIWFLSRDGSADWLLIDLLRLN
jgi:hypothetical protein